MTVRLKLSSAILAAAVLSVAASTASASLRSPQVVFNPTALQSLMNERDPTVNVLTDQQDEQVWSTGGENIFLMELMTGLGPSESSGFYDTNDPSPTLTQVFPGGMLAGSFAQLYFRSGGLTVTLFDQNSIFKSQVTYPGVKQSGLGFYIHETTPAVFTWFSEDARNGPKPQMLLYVGMASLGEGPFASWLCWESDPYDPLGTFDDVVILLGAQGGLPTAPMTWGRLKAAYRK